MIKQLPNKVTSSFYQWFDHTLITEGEGYINKTGNLYPQTDSRIGGYYKYASPHKQWVSDQSATGASIPSGIFVSNSFVPFSGNSLFPDWNNGRILSQNSLSGSLRANYCTKNFNVYLTNESEEKIVFQNKYQFNNFYSIPQSGIQPYSMVLPACFILIGGTESETYSMGSSDFQKEIMKFRVVVMGNHLEDIDSCIGLFMTKKDKCFKLLEYSDSPYNEYGGFKASFPSGYNYSSLADSKDSELVNIDLVNSSKLYAASHEFLPQGMQVAFMNFNLSYYRS